MQKAPLSGDLAGMSRCSPLPCSPSCEGLAQRLRDGEPRPAGREPERVVAHFNSEAGRKPTQSRRARQDEGTGGSFDGHGDAVRVKSNRPLEEVCVSAKSIINICTSSPNRRLFHTLQRVTSECTEGMHHNTHVPPVMTTEI